MRALYIVLLLVASLAMVGCGEVQTEIIESSVQFNTDDTKGPYEVLSVVVGKGQLNVALVYSTDNWQTKKRAEMTKVPSVGEDIYRGSIPGQPAGTTVHYYVEANDEGGQLTTDPIVVPPQAKGVAYKFSVLANP